MIEIRPLEVQNTNAPAIQVYRKLGFRLEGIDISYYTNQDYPDGEIAIFMKRSFLIGASRYGSGKSPG